MRIAPVACTLLLACSCKPDNERPPPERDVPTNGIASRTAVEKVGDVLPDLGAFPLPKELGESPVFVLDDGVYDRDPTGTPVVALEERRLPGADLVVPELLPLFNDRAERQRTRPFGVDLFVDRDTPFHTFARIIATAQDAGFGRFYLGVKNHQGVRRMPLNIPDDGVAPLDLIVSVTRDRLSVWSLSGEDGTVDAPAIDLPASDYGALASGLDKLVPRGNGAPLIVQVAPDVSYQSVVLIIAALRPIARDVLLSLAAS